MIVKTPEARVGVGLGHDDRRRAMAAANVGNLTAGLQFFFDAIERRNPRCDQVRGITRAEETLSAYKQIRIVFTPEHTAAVAKVILDARDRLGHCLDYVESAADEKRTALISQRHCLLRREVITLG